MAMLNFNKFVREHTDLRVNKEAISKIQKLTEDFVITLIKDCDFKAKDSGRKTILVEDVILTQTPNLDDSEDIDSDD